MKLKDFDKSYFELSLTEQQISHIHNCVLDREFRVVTTSERPLPLNVYGKTEALLIVELTSIDVTKLLYINPVLIYNYIKDYFDKRGVVAHYVGPFNEYFREVKIRVYEK